MTVCSSTAVSYNTYGLRLDQGLGAEAVGDVVQRDIML